MLITSVNNQKIKDLVKLHNKSTRDETSLFLVEGDHGVNLAKENNLLSEIIILEQENIDYGVLTTQVSNNVMKKLSKQKSIPKVIGVVKKQESKTPTGNILILDNIQDPGNLGSIIRTSVAFGIETIILSPDSVDIYNDKVIRSSEGFIFKINFIVSDLVQAMKTLKEDGYNIISSVVNSSDESLIIPSKYALIVGNEGNGIRPEIVALSEQTVTIKHEPGVESLNVGVATGIILYELTRGKYVS